MPGKPTRSINLLALTMALLVLAAPEARAVRVENMPTTLVQPDGQQVQAFITGDEFYRSVYDKDGYAIVPDPKTGFYVYAVQAGDDVAPSRHVVGRSDAKALKLAKGVRPSVARLGEYRNERLKAFPMPTKPGARSDERSPSEVSLQQAPTTGTLNNVVIFVRFAGEPEFTDALSVYQGLFNDTSAGSDSLRDYYHQASYSQIDIPSTFYPAPSNGVVVSYQDSHPRGYYRTYSATNTIGYSTGTERNIRATALLKNAALAIASQVPTSLNIDMDNDGKVDDVCYMISGTSDNWADLLWPCSGSLSGDTAYINGKRVWTFTMQFRDWMFGRSNVGVLAHEMFHALGAPDLYHYSHDGLAPAYVWDVMENTQTPPQHMTAYMKWKYGHWISAIPQITTAGTYTLNPLTSPTNNCYKIASPNSATEFFVVEYRRKTGVYESSVPGSGLIVYRINTGYTGNAGGPPDELYIYRPSGTTTLNGNPALGYFSGSTGRTQINDYTNPSSFLTSGAMGGLDISSVGTPGDTISFQVGINQALTPSFSLDTGVYASGQAVAISCQTPGAVIRYTTNGTEPTTLSTVIASGGTVAISTNTTLKAKAWVSGSNPSSTKTARYTFQDRVYVDADSPGPVHDGTTWATAFHSVQDGIDTANIGVSVWVAAHTYTENITLKDVALYGGFTATETTAAQRNWVRNTTVLDGGGAGSVVTIPYLATWRTRLEGFTIQNGSGRPDWQGATVGGGIHMDYSAEPRIAFNVIKSNHAARGGGIYCNDMAFPYIFNNVITANTATTGGGIGCSGEFMAKIIGNTIVGNTASGDGGGVAFDDIWSDPGEIKNNLIASNSSGIYWDSPGATLPIISNNCLYGNVGYAYKNIADQTGSNGNISAYPSFVNSAAGDYHLMYGSSCIDKGSNVNPPSIYDFDGGDRIWDGNQDGAATADIGAYEFRRIHVKYNSPGTIHNGSSWGMAFHTVQQGINVAAPGDEVWVAAGTYNERVTTKDGVKLYGGFAAGETALSQRYWWQNDTVLDGTGTSGSVVTIPAGTGPLTRLDGFTIQNGTASTGGGVWCGAGSLAVIANNKVGPNSASYGGGVYCSNSANSIVNNLLVGNSASIIGGALYLSGSPVVVGYNTIVGNSGSGGGIAYYNCSPVISSNIIAFNTQGVNGSIGSPAYYNNDVYGNTGGNYSTPANPTGTNGNISVDPLFADVQASDYLAGDYHLTGLSPCIDVARNSDRPLSDLDGRPHAIDGNGDGTTPVADIGAYEFRRFMVDATSSAGYYDGSTWTTAYHTIANGLNAARPGDEVWVAVNVYSERITLTDGVALYGGFTGSETRRSQRNWVQNITSIDAAALGRAVTIPDESRASTRIDGFTVKNGKTNLAGGGIYVGQHSKAHIENNRVVGNLSSGTTSGSGGGIYSYIASPTVTNNVICGNAATGSIVSGTFRGGGVYCYGGAPILTNNTIASNSAGASGAAGPGGGVYLDATEAVLKNNIVALNNTGIAKSTSGAPALFYNDVYNTSANYQGLSAGVGDISVDPMFANTSISDYHLLKGSKCIDAGDGTGAPKCDRDGYMRPLDGDSNGVAIVDIGAYEAPTSLGAAKRDLPDGSVVTFGGMSVTASFATGTPCLYVESTDRVCGIRVDNPGASFAEGQLVQVSGTILTDPGNLGGSGERYIDASSGWVRTTGGTLTLEPFTMINRSVGGTHADIPGTVGLDNMGLLVRTSGRVVSKEGVYSFYIDDGSNVHEPGAPGGVHIYGDPSLTKSPAVGQTVVVTGISSARGREVGPQHVLKPRKASDISVVQTPAAYVYNSDTTTANNFKALLDSETFTTDLILASAAKSTDFSRYALIIIGYDSGTWATADGLAGVANINGSQRAIVGIETGGANFFGKLSLNIATNSYFQGATLNPLVPASSIYHSPYEIGVSPASGLVVVSTNASGWYGYKIMSPIPAGVEALGSSSPATRIMLAREQSRYLYWPFRDRPDLLTADGRNLFVNACWYAVK